MAIIANEMTTYDAIGNREDLTDVIAMIAPVDAPFYNACGAASKPKATKHEWQTDTLRAAASNSAVEGDQQGTLEAVTPTSRIHNFLQIQKTEFSVTNTQDAVDKAGRAKELAYQKTKKTKELMLDFEYAFLREVWSTTASGAGDTTHARKMRGALNWCTTNIDKAADAAVAADGTITGGTARTLTEDLIANLCQNIYTAGGKVNRAYCGPFQKRQISSFAGSGNYRTLKDAKTLNAAVDVYVNDFFALDIEPHRNMPTDVVFMPDMDYWKKGALRSLTSEVLPSTADATVVRLLVEHTLEARNEASSGRIVNLTTSN